MKHPSGLPRGVSAFVRRLTIALLIGLLTIGAVVTARAETEPVLPGLADDPTVEGSGEDIPPLTPEKAAHLARFQEPDLTPQQVAETLARYAFVDPQHVIPKALLDRAILYFDVNEDLITNPTFLSVVDFRAASRTVRWHIIDMATGEVVSLRVAHGSGSDPGSTGFAVKFSNTPQSKMSSLGFYLTAEEYVGQHGRSCRLDGLSTTNSNARARAIVIHGADYVEDANVKPGMSWGCLAVSMENHLRVVKGLSGGSLILGSTR